MEPLLLARAMRDAGADEGKADFIAQLISAHIRSGAADMDALEAKVSWRVLKWNLAFFMPLLLALVGLVGWLLNRISALCAG